MLQRTETQWNILMEKIFHLEDVVTNLRSLDHRFKPTFVKPKNPVVRVIYNPVIGLCSQYKYGIKINLMFYYFNNSRNC